MTDAADFFQSWMKGQKQALDLWQETSKKMQESFTGLTGAKPDIWRTADVASDTVSKILGSSNVYTRLYEVWLPLVKAIQEKAGSVESYQDLMNPAKYKEVLDSLFGFTSPEEAAEAFSKAVQFMQAYAATASGFSNPWMDAFQKNMKLLPQFAAGRPESLMQIFHTFFNAFDTTFGKVFHVPAVGKDREKVELLLRSFDDMSVYLAKNLEYQQAMYLTGTKAMEKVINTLAQKVSRGEELKGFDEFFTLWIDVTEKEYLAFFKTEEFSKIQGDLLSYTMNVRKHFFKLMELDLYDLPIALRSEMDDLYKTVYDLKKKLKEVERKNRSVKTEEVPA